MTPTDLARLKALCDAAIAHKALAEIGWYCTPEEFSFMNASRTAVPQLLDEIEQLTSGVREMTLHAGESAARAEKASAEIDRLNAALIHRDDSWETGLEEAEARAEKAEALLRGTLISLENSPMGTAYELPRVLADIRAHLAEQEPKS